MSRYISDPRVTQTANGYTVQVAGQDIHILDSGKLGWGAYTGPSLDLVFTDTGPVLGAATADDLIGAFLKADTA